MRLFIAIPIPRSFKKEIAMLQRALRRESTAGRFVPDDNYHITLHFIGESENLTGAVMAMQEAARGIRPFNLHLAGLDAFDRDEGRTPILKLAGDLEELNALHESLESALYDQGFSRDHKRYVPHITLGRGVICPDEAFAALKKEKLLSSLRAESIVLFESVREQGRISYLPLHTERF